MKRVILMIFLLMNSRFIGAEFFVANASELTSAITKAKPGDVIKMKNGTWNNISINFQSNGTSGNPIYLKAETAGHVVLSGKSNLRIAGDYLVVDGLVFKNGSSNAGTAVVEFRSSGGIESKYSRLTNTSIIDFNPTDVTIDYKWISLYGERNRVDHCYLKGKNHLGTTLVVWLSSKPNYHLIDSNYFAVRPPYPENGAETIRVGTSDWSMYDSFTTVEYNYFEECNGETEIISSKSCGNIYRYNTFKNCQGTLTLRHGNRCIVEGNYFFCGKKTDSGGIRIIGEDHKVINNYIEDSYGTSYKSGITLMNGVLNSPLNRYFQVKRAIVANNTIVNAKTTLHIGAGKDSELTLAPTDCIIANNIFYSTTSPLVTFSDQPINLKWSGNIFYGTSIGMNLPSGNFNVDPKISKGTDNIFRITSASPAINSSDPNYNYVTNDIDGQTRISGNDIGADEFSNDPIKIKPIGPNDIGPAFMRNTTNIGEFKNDLPKTFQLFQNYPNPFNPETVISWQLTVHSHVTLKVFDVLGREVATLVDELKPVGFYNYQLSIFNLPAGKAGYQLPSGIYFYTLRCGRYTETKKFCLMK